MKTALLNSLTTYWMLVCAMKISVLTVCLLFLCAACRVTDFNSQTSRGVEVLDFSNIKLITFDLFTTLMDTRTAIRNNVRRTAMPFLTQNQCDRLANAWVLFFKQYGMEYNSLLKNKGAHFPIDNPFQLVIQVGLNTTLGDLRAPELHPLVKTELLKAWRNLVPWERTGWVLSQLRNMTLLDGTTRRFKLGVLSNGDRETMEDACKIFEKDDNFKFDYMIGSSDSGLFKPEPQFYEVIEKKFGFKRHEVLHVAGARYDALGAKVYGYRVAWNFGNLANFVNLMGLKEYEPDVILSNLQELLSILTV